MNSYSEFSPPVCDADGIGGFLRAEEAEAARPLDLRSSCCSCLASSSSESWGAIPAIPAIPGRFSVMQNRAPGCFHLNHFRSLDRNEGKVKSKVPV